ncbi:RSC6/BAF60A ortholog with a SWIB domain [Babesia caballi]|uniref:RSC6/BAF60A ortholog with a SWIB domain n=1 Tax=Babesia caballi TaxID=5871 RepID=A0AAV4LQF0_BABCB|nr:RSC6/BAF60A ortholog with a SWIB domain [Babesia caballi]
MLAALLAHLERSNPRQCAILKDLESLESRLDELLALQSNTASLNTSEAPPRIRLHIYNTCAEDKDENGVGYLHTVPSMYTLHVRAYEVDEDGNVIDSVEPGVLCRYFRQILLCTPDRTVLWDRDGIREYHTYLRGQPPDWTPPVASSLLFDIPRCSHNRDGQGAFSGSQDGALDGETRRFVDPVHGSDMVRDSARAAGGASGHVDHRLLDDGQPHGNVDSFGVYAGNLHDPGLESWLVGRSNDADCSVDDRGGDPGPFNGYEELEINQAFSTDCQVTLYFFPAQTTTMCTVSDLLNEFLLMVNNGVAVTDSTQQIAFYRVISLLWVYAFKNQLVYEMEKGAFFNIDSALAQLMDLPEGSSLAVRDVPHALLPHIMPPKPIKVTHEIVLGRKFCQGDSIMDIRLDRSVSLQECGVKTLFESQIEGLEAELRDLIHIRNIYQLYTEDPYEYINFMLNRCPVDNPKPLCSDLLKTPEHLPEVWLPRAIDKYMAWCDRPVFELLYGSFNNFSKSDGKSERPDLAAMAEMRAREGPAERPGKRDNDNRKSEGAPVAHGEERERTRPSSTENARSETKRHVPSTVAKPVLRTASAEVIPPMSTDVHAPSIGELARDKVVEDLRFTDIYNLSGTKAVGSSDGLTVPGSPSAVVMDHTAVPSQASMMPFITNTGPFDTQSMVNSSYGAGILSGDATLPKPGDNVMDASSLVDGGNSYLASVGAESKLGAIGDFNSNGTNFQPSFSGETQFNIMDHFVGEGSSTIEGNFSMFTAGGSGQFGGTSDALANRAEEAVFPLPSAITTGSPDVAGAQTTATLPEPAGADTVAHPSQEDSGTLPSGDSASDGGQAVDGSGLPPS